MMVTSGVNRHGPETVRLGPETVRCMRLLLVRKTVRTRFKVRNQRERRVLETLTF